MNDPVISFREGTADDMEAVERLFMNERRGPTSPGWAAWKYLRSPDGPARLFVAERAPGDMVGTLAYMPRVFTRADRSRLDALQVVDVLVRSDARGQHVYSQLATFAEARAAGPRYGFPTAQSQRMPVVGKGEQWSFPVRVGGLVRAGLPGGAPLSNAAAGLYRAMWLPARPGSIRLRRIDRFEHEYRVPGAIHGVRSAAYLNWRFLECPIRKYYAFAFLNRSERLGYCVYTVNERAVQLADFVAERSTRGCLRALVDHARDRDATHLLVRGVGLGLRRFGFLRRKVYGVCTASGFGGGRWYLTNCDSDTEVG